VKTSTHTHTHTHTYIYIYIYIYIWQYLVLFLQWKMFQTKGAEKIKTKVLCSTNVFPKIMPFMTKWKNMIEPVGPHHSIIRHRRVACWINMPTDTHTLKMCNNYWFSTTTTVTRTRLNITFIPTLPVLSLVMRLRMSGFLPPLLHMPSCRAERQQMFLSILQPNDVIGLLIRAWLLSCIQFGGDLVSQLINVVRCTNCWLLSVDLSLSLLTKHIDLQKKLMHS